MTNPWTHGQIVGVERTGLSDGEASASREACCMASAAYVPPTARQTAFFTFLAPFPVQKARGHDVLLWQ